MATGTQTKTPAGPGQTANQKFGKFVELVAKGTGLDPNVVTAWVLAERGPADNPLNIGPGRHYGTGEAAAAATVKLLTTDSRYAHVIAATKSGKIGDQITAISSSPFDSCHYRGLLSNGRCANAKPGTLLSGLYRDLTGFPASTSTVKPGGATESAVGDSESPLMSGISGAVSGVEGWITKEAVVALAYVGLVAAALAFIVLGSTRATGFTPLPLARAGKGGGEDDIPF